MVWSGAIPIALLFLSLRWSSVGADSVRDVFASRLGFPRRFGARAGFVFRPLGRVPFGKRPKRNQKVSPLTSGFSLREKYPRFLGVSGGRREGPSMASRGFRGIHAALPLKLRSPSAS